MSLPFLESIGLTEKESDIYELLLQEGEVPAQRITSKTRLKRATVYKSLYGLEAKGLISKRTLNKKIHFKPESPTELSKLAEAQINKIERAQKDLRTLLPELISKYIISVEKPVITQYEGVQGLQKAFEDIYSKKDEPVYGCVDLEVADASVPHYITIKLIPLRIKNKLFAKSFISQSPQAEEVHKKDAQSYRESVLLDKDTYPLPAEIDVYEDKIAMMSFTRGQFVALIIKNQDMATSLKSIFKLAFDQSHQTAKPSEAK